MTAPTTAALPSTISSPQDLSLLILDVKKYAKWYLQYYTAQKAKTKYAELQPEISKIASELIISWDKQAPLTPTNLEDRIKSLEKTARTAPVINITLASPPSQEIKKTIADWCRSNLSPDILISFQFNSTILGGMILRTGSKIYDWSFRTKIINAKKSFSEVIS